VIKIELVLFITFMTISCVFIGLGLYRLEHTELALVGFFFMFLLSMVVIGDNLEYVVGYEEVYIYGSNLSDYHFDDYGVSPTFKHDIDDAKDTLLFHMNRTNIYQTYQDDSGFFTTHNFGYLLAVMSIIGIIGSFVSIKPERFFK